MTKGLTGISLVFAAGLLAASCGGSSGTSMSMPTGGTTSGTSATADVTVTIAGMSFSPNNVTVQVGQTVVWKNTDGVTHTATQDGGGFDTGAIPAGGTSKAVTVTSSGAMHYHCTIHPSMTGTINGSAGGGGGY